MDGISMSASSHGNSQDSDGGMDQDSAKTPRFLTVAGVLLVCACSVIAIWTPAGASPKEAKKPAAH